MRGRGEADEDDAGGRITEAGHRTGPVVPAAEATRRIGRRRGPPLVQAGTGGAVGDLLAELSQGAEHHNYQGSRRVAVAAATLDGS